MKKLFSVFLVLCIVLSITFALADSLSTPANIVSLLSNAYSDTEGVDYAVSYNRTTEIYTINVTIDGGAGTVSLAKSGKDSSDTWTKIRKSLLSIGETTLDFVKNMSGDDNSFVSIGLKDDQNSDGLLFCTLNSVVIYDAVSDESSDSE